jgi:uncharacterized protein (TIGR03083 family)
MMTFRKSALDRSVAMHLAETEFSRCAELLGSLRESDWQTRTECTEWDVRQMAAHMLGMVELAASVREGRRQTKAATASGAFDIDAMTALQVTERADWSGPQIAERFAQRWPAAVRGRRRTPWFMRRRPIPPLPINGSQEVWSLGYLVDVILTRDPWTHRMDICRALRREPLLTADHDGLLVADVVSEWAGRHGKDFTLRLTGPAGGTWSIGTNGPDIELDAVEFCRVLSKRPGAVPLDMLMSTEVPF